MPEQNSVAKRHKQSEARRLRNRMAKSQIRSSNKRFLLAVENNEKEAAGEEFRKFIKLLDTATSKGVFHKNTTARKKSRMNKLLNKVANVK